MEAFLHGLTSYPGIIPSVLLGVLLMFWLMAIIGLVDLETLGGGDLDLDLDLDAADGVGFSGALVGLGFHRLPFSVVASSIVFLWWLLTLLGMEFVLAWLPLPTWMAGTLLLLATLLIALPLAAMAVRPLHPLFRVYQGALRQSLPGKDCVILTQNVDENFGQAEVRVGNGTPLNLRVWAPVPNSLSRGSPALLLEYDESRDRYQVQARPE